MQAAGRMRLLGKGQTLCFVGTAEVSQSIRQFAQADVPVRPELEPEQDVAAEVSRALAHGSDQVPRDSRFEAAADRDVGPECEDPENVQQSVAVSERPLGTADGTAQGRALGDAEEESTRSADSACGCAPATAAAATVLSTAAAAAALAESDTASKSAASPVPVPLLEGEGHRASGAEEMSQPREHQRAVREEGGAHAVEQPLEGQGNAEGEDTGEGLQENTDGEDQGEEGVLEPLDTSDHSVQSLPNSLHSSEAGVHSLENSVDSSQHGVPVEEADEGDDRAELEGQICRRECEDEEEAAATEELLRADFQSPTGQAPADPESSHPEDLARTCDSLTAAIRAAPATAPAPIPPADTVAVAAHTPASVRGFGLATTSASSSATAPVTAAAAGAIVAAAIIAQEAACTATPPSNEAFATESARTGQGPPITSQHILQWVVANTIQATEEAFVEFVGQGCLHQLMQQSPDYAVQPEVLGLQQLYGADRRSVTRKSLVDRQLERSMSKCTDLRAFGAFNQRMHQRVMRSAAPQHGFLPALCSVAGRGGS